jgi:hypothetical protein
MIQYSTDGTPRGQCVVAALEELGDLLHCRVPPQKPPLRHGPAPAPPPCRPSDACDSGHPRVLCAGEVLARARDRAAATGERLARVLHREAHLQQRPQRGHVPAPARACNSGGHGRGPSVPGVRAVETVTSCTAEPPWHVFQCACVSWGERTFFDTKSIEF